VLMLMAMWSLYRNYLQAPAAPAPPVRRAETIVISRSHA